MINRQILLETEYTDFISNDKPISNNVADWFMQIYELEFKLNLINRHPEMFDIQDNTSNISLDTVRETLEKSSKIIGKYLISVIYQLIQNWKNFHDVSKFIPNIIQAGNIYDKSHDDFPYIDEAISKLKIENILLNYPKKGNREELYNINIENLNQLLYKTFNKPTKNGYQIEKILANTCNALKINNTPNYVLFYTKIKYIIKKYFDKYPNNPKLDYYIINDINTNASKFYSHFFQIGTVYQMLKKVSNKDQENYKQEVIIEIYNKLTEAQNEFISDLARRYKKSTGELVDNITKIVDDLYSMLINIDHVSQSNILMNSNIAITTVHHRSDFQDLLSYIGYGIWFQSDTYKYYPYDVREIIPKEIIDFPVKKGNLTFDSKEQVRGAISRLSYMFEDKDEAQEYIAHKYLKYVNKYGETKIIRLSSPSGFMRFLSNLPKPELRYWQQELTKFGLDRHIHLLMDIDGSRLKNDKQKNITGNRDYRFYRE